ncbi:MAG: thiol-disulfide oxidoreductase DCC family protein [Dehalococcoidia bacterium]
MKNNEKINEKNNIYPFVLFYDGYCILCSRSIDFIIKHDKKEKILFASLQSKYASETLSEMGYNPQDIAKLDNVIYLRNGVIKIKSNAVLSILSDINGIYKLCKIFYIIPGFIRDFIYDQIALRRYKWFGKRETCRVPTNEEKLRILG